MIESIGTIILSTSHFFELLLYSCMNTLYMIEEEFLSNDGGNLISHGDIKPGNIILDSTKTIPVIDIIDFGTCGPSNGYNFAATGLYLAPERMGNTNCEKEILLACLTTNSVATTLDSRSPREYGNGDDLYALSITMLEFLMCESIEQKYGNIPLIAGKKFYNDFISSERYNFYKNRIPEILDMIEKSLTSKPKDRQDYFFNFKKSEYYEMLKSKEKQLQMKRDVALFFALIPDNNESSFQLPTQLFKHPEFLDPNKFDGFKMESNRTSMDQTPSPMHQYYLKILKPYFGEETFKIVKCQVNKSLDIICRRASSRDRLHGGDRGVRGPAEERDRSPTSTPMFSRSISGNSPAEALQRDYDHFKQLENYQRESERTLAMIQDQIDRCHQSTSALPEDSAQARNSSRESAPSRVFSPSARVLPIRPVSEYAYIDLVRFVVGTVIIANLTFDEAKSMLAEHRRNNPSPSWVADDATGVRQYFTPRENRFGSTDPNSGFGGNDIRYNQRAQSGNQRERETGRRSNGQNSRSKASSSRSKASQ